MKILIIGGLGYTGSLLTQKLLNEGNFITTIDTAWFGDYLKKQKNLKKLLNKIKNKLKKQFVNSENILITRERHRENLEECAEHLQNFIKKKTTDDFDKAAEDLRLATRYLGIIVGKIDVEEILDSIFNDFCIGK